MFLTLSFAVGKLEGPTRIFMRASTSQRVTRIKAAAAGQEPEAAAAALQPSACPAECSPGVCILRTGWVAVSCNR